MAAPERSWLASENGLGLLLIVVVIFPVGAHRLLEAVDVHTAEGAAAARSPFEAVVAHSFDVVAQSLVVVLVRHCF